MSELVSELVKLSQVKLSLVSPCYTSATSEPPKVVQNAGSGVPFFHIPTSKSGPGPSVFLRF